MCVSSVGDWAVSIALVVDMMLCNQFVLWQNKGERLKVLQEKIRRKALSGEVGCEWKDYRNGSFQNAGGKKFAGMIFFCSFFF